MSRARQLFQRHHLAVFRYLARFTGSRDRAEELTQEVFLRALRALPRYRPEGREEAWIFTLARNVALDERTRRAKHREDGPATGDESRSEPPRAGLRACLAEALERLHPGERDAFLLREIGGLSYAEIAPASAMTADAVRARIYRARRTLRMTLGGQAGAGNVRRFNPSPTGTGENR